ncbi:MAG TPA: YceI family protein [Bacteroidia bacterium]|jgi:polyisoprenoid-binding protein YceI
MKKSSFFIIALVIIISSGFSASLLWNVSPEGLTVNFELPDEGTKGTISGLKASIDFDYKDPSAAKISATMDINTLDAGNAQKTKHLLSADFFNAEKFPTASFVSSAIKANADEFIATGALTIKDSTKTIEIPFTFTEGTDGSGTFKGTITLFSGDYGIMKKSKTGKDKVVITLTVPVKK